MSSHKPCHAQLSSLFPLKKPLVVTVLLAAALAGCGQQVDAPKAAEQAPATPREVASAPAAMESVAPASEAASAAASAASAAASAASAAQGEYQFPPLTPEAETVKQRAQERWDALLAGDFERAWSYLEPAAREGIKQEDYKKRFGASVEWVSATARNVKCITARCAVLVRMVTRAAMPASGKGAMELTNHFEEEWVQEEGQWWHRGLRSPTPKEGEEPLPSAAAPSHLSSSAPVQGAFGGSSGAKGR